MPDPPTGPPHDSRPADQYEVLALRYGTATTRRSEVFHRYRLYGEPDKEMTIDFYLWVLRNPHRTIVVDTGFQPAAGARRGRQTLRAPAMLLADVGIDPATVDRVVLTHLHYDHTGNTAQFPRAQFLVDSRELEFWTTSPTAGRLLFAHSVEPTEIDQLRQLDRHNRVERLGPTTVIAPGVQSRRIGGHTPGQQIVQVRTDHGEVVLASDALHFYEELDRDRPFAVVCDLDEMYRGYDTLRELAARPGTDIVAGHDPLVLQRFAPIDGSPGAGVRVDRRT